MSIASEIPFPSSFKPWRFVDIYQSGMQRRELEREDYPRFKPMDSFCDAVVFEFKERITGFEPEMAKYGSEISFESPDIEEDDGA